MTSGTNLLSQRGMVAVDLAQALDWGNENQVKYLVDLIHRINLDYAPYTGPLAVLQKDSRL